MDDMELDFENREKKLAEEMANEQNENDSCGAKASFFTRRHRGSAEQDSQDIDSIPYRGTDGEAHINTRFWKRILSD